MKKQFIILLMLITISLAASAQEYRLARSTGQLKLNMSGVTVEGYDGKEIIFSGQKVIVDEPTDERARGLVPISSSKYTDNTGIGINVTENGQDVDVNVVSKKPIGILSIKVPQNMRVSVLNNGFTNNFVFSYNTSSNRNKTANDTDNTDKLQEEIVLKNLKNEIEVSVYQSNIRLENNTGPMNIKTVSGSVDAIFNTDIKGPVSIVSVANYVDVTLPASTKANIEMGTNNGKLFAGKEFKFDLDKSEMEENGFRAGNRQAYTINGNNVIALSGKMNKQDTTNKEIVVTGYKTGELLNADGWKTKSLTGVVNGVEVKGSGVQISNGAVYLPSTAFPRGSFFGGDRIKGKLNGGGIDLIFKSTNKNVYLREK